MAPCCYNLQILAIRVASNGSYWRQGSMEVFLDDMEALQTLGATQPWSSLFGSALPVVLTLHL